MTARSAPTPRLRDLPLQRRVLDGRAYDDHLYRLQLELLRLQTRLRDSRRLAVAVVFEGMDAAGKGGAIRRLTGRLDPRGYRVHPIGPPTEIEKAQHWLWRFSSRMPARGEIAIFDRSWYGRVLVERVEKLTPRATWQRAFDEILSFERMHVEDGTIVVKFWMHVSKNEQLQRFQEREKDPFKEYKIGPADWRARKSWSRYVGAAEEMLARTHAPFAPWTVVPGDDKHYARVAVLHQVVKQIGALL